MKLVECTKKHFVLSVPAGRIKIRGMAKQQQPRLLEALEAQARLADTPSP
jgi:hypothetical protein